MPCIFALNGATFTSLMTPAGVFAAFSGDGPHRNNPESVGVADGGPIPFGLYHIVDRESGGILGPIRDWALGRDKWFALYRDDDAIDDATFVRGVRRGQFRLHPLGPRRMSTGCVVLQYQAEFDRFRAHLLKSPTTLIPECGLRSYGTLSVCEPVPDLLRKRTAQQQAVA